MPSKLPPQLKGPSLELVIMRGHHQASSAAVSKAATNGPTPFCKFINVELCDAKPSLGARSTRGTVLLENPPGDFLLSLDQLTNHVAVIFGLHGRKIKLYRSKNKNNGKFIFIMCPPLCLKALFKNVFTFKIWAAFSYMLSVSLIRRTNETLKKMHLKSTIKRLQRSENRQVTLPIDCCVRINGKPDHLFSGDIQS